MSSLPRAGELVSLGTRPPRWRPGLPCLSHSDIFAEGNEASGAALALALVLAGLPPSAERDVLWVQAAASIGLTGRPYPLGRGTGRKRVRQDVEFSGVRVS